MTHARKPLTVLLLLLLALLLSGCAAPQTSPAPAAPSLSSASPAQTEKPILLPTLPPEAETLLDEDGSYTTKEDVALYLHTFGRLPGNYITKSQARALGWQGGDLRPYAEGRTIGGDRFGNYEGLLPEKKGRQYYECDIDTLGRASRGPRRIVYSNDGLIYYTDDHYESFTLLYGEDGHATR